MSLRACAHKHPVNFTVPNLSRSSGFGFARTQNRNILPAQDHHVWKSKKYGRYRSFFLDVVCANSLESNL